MRDALFILFQKLVPQHALSRLVGRLAASKNPRLSQLLIKAFAKKFAIDMSLAARENLADYTSFNDFFTRALKPEARPIAADADLVCPADGAISQLGAIKSGVIYQAKGKSFTLNALLGSDVDCQHYHNGEFITVYLSPRDYHRVHMPFAGRLVKTSYIPGDLFSVNQTTAENIDGLFARNERLVCMFETEFGQASVILVGAMIVAGIETVWDGVVAPSKNSGSNSTVINKVWTKYYPEKNAPVFAKGDEMGRFMLGSTAIVILPETAPPLAKHLQAGAAMNMGEALTETALKEQVLTGEARR